jgi:putative transposase
VEKEGGQSCIVVLLTFMARPLRVEFPGALYHVIVRGNERKAVFRDDRDREDYLRRLAHYAQKFEFRVLAYCLMDNHIHLAIEAGKVPLSRIMACLQSSYTQYFNRRHRRVGHLFQGRYKAWLIEKDLYALALLRYIHENPVKAKIVARPQEYEWSSDRLYRRGKGQQDWLAVDRLLPMLGRGRSAAIRGYRKLMREELEEPYENVETWGQAIKGNEAFADRVLQAAGEPRVLRRHLTVETIARRVAQAQGIDPSEMATRGRGRAGSEARALTAWVGREVAGISIARTAKHFGRETSSMARNVARLEERMATANNLRSRCETLVASLSPGRNTTIRD